MGTDIHFYVEKKQDGKWVSADTWYPNEDCGDGYKSIYKMGSGFEILSGPMYSSRNYGLFAMLANVRNGFGFAGVDTGDALFPIFETRGFPEDASPEVTSAYELWDSGGHSTTYMTVQELMEYDWTQIMRKRGFVNKKEFVRFKLTGKPDSWCGGTSAPKISNDDMLAKILEECGDEKLGWNSFHNLKDDLFTGFVTSVEWDIPYYEQAAEFLSETMPKLWRLGKPNEVRIVIWFDS